MTAAVAGEGANRSCRLLALLVLSMLLAPSGAPAQASGAGGGIWASAGVGAGLDESERWGPAGYVRGGTALGPQLRVGLQALLFERVSFTDTSSKLRSSVTATLLYHPLDDGGLSLKAGAGLATEDERTFGPDGEPGETTTVRPGVNLGIGHGLRPGGGGLVVTPNLDLLLGLSEDGLLDPDAAFLLTLGIGVG